MRLAPRTDGMKKGCSWEGFALPDPPVGRGPGARASGLHPQGDHRVLLGGLCPPRPSRGWGHGETWFPHTPRRGLMFTLEGPGAAEPPPAGCLEGRQIWRPSMGIDLRGRLPAGRGGGPQALRQAVVARPRREGRGDCAGPPGRRGREKGGAGRRSLPAPLCPSGGVGKPGFPTPPPTGGSGRTQPARASRRRAAQRHGAAPRAAPYLRGMLQ